METTLVTQGSIFPLFLHLPLPEGHRGWAGSEALQVLPQLPGTHKCAWPPAALESKGSCWGSPGHRAGESLGHPRSWVRGSRQLALGKRWKLGTLHCLCLQGVGSTGRAGLDPPDPTHVFRAAEQLCQAPLSCRRQAEGQEGVTGCSRLQGSDAGTGSSTTVNTSICEQAPSSVPHPRDRVSPRVWTASRGWDLEPAGRKSCPPTLPPSIPLRVLVLVLKLLVDNAESGEEVTQEEDEEGETAHEDLREPQKHQSAGGTGQGHPPAQGSCPGAPLTCHSLHSGCWSMRKRVMAL